MRRERVARRSRSAAESAALLESARLAFCGAPCGALLARSVFCGAPLRSVCARRCDAALPCSTRVRKLYAARLRRRRPRAGPVCLAANSNPFAWIVNGVGGVTAGMWAVVAEKTFGAPQESREVESRDGQSRLASAHDGRESGRGQRARAIEGATSRDSVGEDFIVAVDEEDVDDDDDGVAERIAVREAGDDSEDSDGVEARMTVRRARRESRDRGRRRIDADAALKEPRSPSPKAVSHVPEKASKRERDSVEKKQSGRREKPRFFLFGRGQSSASDKNGSGRSRSGEAAATRISYGGLEQRRVAALINEGLSIQSDASLHTPLPYNLQRQIFSELQTRPVRKRRRKREATAAPPKDTSGGLKSHIPISRDVLRPVTQSVSGSNGGSNVASTIVLDRIQRDMERLETRSDSSRRKAKRGKKPSPPETEKVKNSQTAGIFGLLGWVFGGKSDSGDDAGPDLDTDTALLDADSSVASPGRTSNNRKGEHGRTLQVVQRSIAAGEAIDEDEVKAGGSPRNGELGTQGNSGVLNVPLGMVGELLNAVWWVRDQEERSTGEQDERSKKSNVAAYAVAMTRDMSVMEEADIIDGGSVAAAVAAASAIATSTQASELDSIEAAGLQASVSAARAVNSREDADVFVDTVGVGALVVATRVLAGNSQSSALTALANIAILRPKSRGDMLKADGGSIIGSITAILLASERVSAVSTVVDRAAALCKMEALVSGAHLIGSLALAGGLVGSEWRGRMATDASLVSCLNKLAGGVQKGEPEGAARAARRALGALGINHWTPRIAGQRGLRILTIDGGGTRAIMAFEMLKHLEMLTGSKIADMFDVIGGTSTGAIVAASLGIAHKSVEDVESLYRRLIGKIFAKNAGPVQGAKLLLTKAFYDTQVLEEALKRECGTGVFIDSLAEEGMNKVFVVSSIMSRSPHELHVFRNYTYPLGHESRYDGTAEAQLWEALRASSAAPTYFSEILVNGELHADGAIVANNPTAVALHETKCMYPGVPIECVVSMGNGLSAADIAAASRRNGAMEGDPEKGKSVGWGDVVGSIVASATNTEGVHNALDDLFPKSKYFRFNPITKSNEIDETSPEKLAAFVNDARSYIEQNPDRFAEAARLLRPKTNRSLWRRFKDALSEELSALSSMEDDVYLL